MRRLPTLLLALCLTFVGGTLPARAQHSEADVKAAFIFNIARYAEWPDNALPEGGVLRICLLGDAAAGSPLHDALTLLGGRTIRGRLLEVRAGPRFDPLKPCHVTVMFPGAAERRRVLFDERHTLTIADGEDFIEQGGALGIVTVERRLQFEANLEAARRAGIYLPAQLLKLARRVKGA